MIISVILQILLMLLPWALRRKGLTRLLNATIHNTASIGISLILAKHFEMQEYASIGNLTIIKGLDYVQLKKHASIGTLNWITGFPSGTASKHFKDNNNRRSEILLERHASITNRHYIDCTDSLSIGAFSTVAGVRSQILTHSIDFTESQQRSAPVNIGSFCFVSTGCILLPNTKLPDNSVLGAGAVLNKNHTTPYTLYAGVPAKAIKQLDKDSKYFTRHTGFVI